MLQAYPSSLAAPLASPALDALSGSRVLVAEDNEVNLEVAKFHLENLGCTPVAAANGAIALDLARTNAFDYVLMDCQMPVMNGFEALEAIRLLDAALAHRRTPVIAVTAADDTESQQECARAGFDGFLAKPYSADQLRSALLRCNSQAVATTSAPDKHTEATTEASPGSIDTAAFTAFVNDFGIDCADGLLRPFVALLHETSARLDAARAGNDVAALQALSHKVAGAAGTVGATVLSRQARAIEGQLKRGSPVSTADVDRLKDQVTLAAGDFDRLLQPGSIAELMKVSHP